MGTRRKWIRRAGSPSRRACGNDSGSRPGSEVEIREQDGTAVVEPEDDPEDIVEDLEGMIETAAADRDQPPYEDLDTQSRDHVDTIQRQASETETGDE